MSGRLTNAAGNEGAGGAVGNRTGGHAFACPLCGLARRPGLFEAARGGPYRVCAACGSASGPGTLDYARHYADYFPDLVAEDSPLLAERYHAILQRAERLTAGIRGTRTPSLLEVGCGNGQLLAVARERGWRVAGVELSAAQADHCRARGLEVVCGDLLGDDLFEDRRFDAAVMLEVFEHLPNPRPTLRALASRLQPGGVVYLTTPNFNALARRLLGARWSVLHEEHVTLATAEGLRRSLRDCRLATIEIGSRNVNLAELAHGFGRRAPMAGSQRAAAAADARDRIEASAALRVLKAILNVLLRASNLGETLVAWGRNG